MKKIRHKRFWVLYGTIGLTAAMILSRLYVMQVQGGEEARRITDSRLTLSARIPAPRGEITDRYGRTLVTSRTGYRVDVDKTDITKQELCDEIIMAFSLLSGEEQASFKDAVPISFEAPYIFEETDSTKAFQKEQELSKNCSAEEAIHILCKKYGVKETYALREKRLLCGVFYTMEQEGFSAAYPYVLAENVGNDTVMRMKEQAFRIPSISVRPYPVRTYLYPQTAVHLLGRVGKISREEYERKRSEGYGKNDYIGKQGAEKAFESALRGADGVKAIFKHADFISPREAVPGDTVILTVDLLLQQATEQALENAVSRTYRAKRNGAAAVVMDVHSGEILASASYPDYDVTTFGKNYQKLAESAAKPMFHRSLAGLYAPGSTFKPISAIAAIDSGVVKPEETVKTMGEYTYLDRTFRCNIFRTKGETHGTVNLAEALGVSCNYYFFDLATKTKIGDIEEVAKAYGLGSRTGSELSYEEAEGNIATPQARKKRGGIWYPGDVLQAAIGQSDHLFTPIQLANYAAAIAHGGTLYRTTILKATKSSETGKVTLNPGEKILRKIETSEQALSAVQEGMRLVTAPGGTAEQAFLDFPVQVAGKTGSAQVPGGTNGLFIGYAPAEKPQIALCVVIENGGAGSLAAEAARDIFSAYFEKAVPAVSHQSLPNTVNP